jgi:hypothetical protein
MDSKFVLMSGYPGAGKSKDAILTTLYAAFEFGPGDAAAPLRTGRAGDAARKYGDAVRNSSPSRRYPSPPPSTLVPS